MTPSASYNPRMFYFLDSLGAHARHIAVFAVVVLGGCLAAIAAKDFVMPAGDPARTYPAHDEHPQEKVTVAIDPYDVEYKANIFTVNYRKFGFLPVLLVVTNDGDQPLALAGMQAQLNTVDRNKLSPSTAEDLARRMSHPSRSDTPNPLPIPLPGKKVKGGLSERTMDEDRPRPIRRQGG